MSNKGIFLDRDGTLIFDKHYLSEPDEVELVPGAKEFVHQAKKMGYKLYLFSNQSGVGRGFFTLETVHECNKKMYELLDIEGIDGECIATEMPDDEILYRKPSARYIEEIIQKDELNREKSWMVGDKIADIQAGINGRIRPAWVATGKPMNEELQAVNQSHNVLEINNIKDLLQHLE